MAGLTDALREGTWLTRERVRLVATMLIAASLVAAAVLIATADGRNDRFGRPLGTDFANVYAAGTYVLEGKPAAPFDPARQHAREQEIFGKDTPFFGWHYPPFFLGMAAALAALPYGLALLLWQGATLALYLWAMRGVLAGGTLVQLDRRPTLAGLLFGLLAYKPQFGLLIPLVLAASGRWRAFAAASATVAAFALAVTLAFGTEVWTAFLASTEFSRTVVLEQGGTGWHKIQSAFSLVRMWGGAIAFAYAAQGTVTAAVAAALVFLWRGSAAFPLKAAGLLIGTVLATPYVLDYDLVLLAPAIAFLAAHGAAHGFRPFEKTMLALLWLVPLVARTVAHSTLIPLAVPAMAATFALLLHRAISPLAAGRVDAARQRVAAE